MSMGLELFQLWKICNKNWKKEKKILLIWTKICTYISIQLPYKAWEIIMLKVSWKNTGGERMGIPHNKTMPPSVPRNNIINGRILHHFKGFGQKWWRAHIVQPFHWLRWWRWRRRWRHSIWLISWLPCSWTWWSSSRILFLHWIYRIHYKVFLYISYDVLITRYAKTYEIQRKNCRVHEFWNKISKNANVNWRS